MGNPDIADLIAQHGLPAILAILANARAELIAYASRHPGTRMEQLIHHARSVLARHEPMLSRTLHDSVIAGWLVSARNTSSRIQRPRRPGPPVQTPALIPPAEPVVRFPIIETAAADLLARQILTQQDYENLSVDAKRTAFTIARVHSIRALDQLRKDLAKNVQFGGTLGEFQKGFEAIAGRALSPSQVETVYRTQVSQAVSAGTRAMMANPIVSGAFPYLLWTATHDGRVRPEHLAMEKHGQGGSAVYRADDPMFRLLYPPAGYNCRCHVIPLSLEDAARHGSPEARKWLETGRPPVVPDWARRPYPITLPPGWPVSDRITSVAV